MADELTPLQERVDRLEKQMQSMLLAEQLPTNDFMRPFRQRGTRNLGSRLRPLCRESA